MTVLEERQDSMQVIAGFEEEPPEFHTLKVVSEDISHSVDGKTPKSKLITY